MEIDSTSRDVIHDDPLLKHPKRLFGALLKPTPTSMGVAGEGKSIKSSLIEKSRIKTNKLFLINSDGWQENDFN